MEENTSYLRDPAIDLTAIPGQIDAQPAAWKEIENGRFQPQRIKGSCLGRELG
jgi:hypothetical protein